MVQQNFKIYFPPEMLFDFLKLHCEKIGDCFIFSNLAFDLAQKKGDIDEFCNQMKPFYYSSKLKYIDKKQKFTSFMTVIRQICRYHKIGYTSKVKYIKSYYEIIYYIKKPSGMCNSLKDNDNQIIDKNAGKNQ